MTLKLDAAVDCYPLSWSTRRSRPVMLGSARALHMIKTKKRSNSSGDGRGPLYHSTGRTRKGARVRVCLWAGSGQVMPKLLKTCILIIGTNIHAWI